MEAFAGGDALVEAPAATGLALAAADWGAALIAVRSSPRGPIATALFGSVPRDLARDADRPVLVFPRRSHRAVVLPGASATGGNR